MKKLGRKFYTREDTLQIARELLGKTLVVPDDNGRRISGRIVECEAYLGAADKAAHSYQNRRTNRTEVMFDKGGTSYVFFVYGMYFQFNVVTGKRDSPHAILIRAVEPVEGVEVMKARRGPKTTPRNLTSGPGKLCIALGLDKTFNGENLLGERVWIEDAPDLQENQVAAGKRIGIDYAGDDAEKPWRFWIKENPFVSRQIRRTLR